MAPGSQCSACTVCSKLAGDAPSDHVGLGACAQMTFARNLGALWSGGLPCSSLDSAFAVATDGTPALRALSRLGAIVVGVVYARSVAPFYNEWQADRVQSRTRQERLDAERGVMQERWTTGEPGPRSPSRYRSRLTTFSS